MCCLLIHKFRGRLVIWVRVQRYVWWTSTSNIMIVWTKYPLRSMQMESMQFVICRYSSSSIAMKQVSCFQSIIRLSELKKGCPDNLVAVTPMLFTRFRAVFSDRIICKLLSITSPCTIIALPSEEKGHEQIGSIYRVSVYGMQICVSMVWGSFCVESIQTYSSGTLSPRITSTLV